MKAKVNWVFVFILLIIFHFPVFSQEINWLTNNVNWTYSSTNLFCGGGCTNIQTNNPQMTVDNDTTTWVYTLGVGTIQYNLGSPKTINHFKWMSNGLFYRTIRFKLEYSSNSNGTWFLVKDTSFAIANIPAEKGIWRHLTFNAINAQYWRVSSYPENNLHSEISEVKFGLITQSDSIKYYKTKFSELKNDTSMYRKQIRDTTQILNQLRSDKSSCNLHVADLEIQLNSLKSDTASKGIIARKIYNFAWSVESSVTTKVYSTLTGNFDISLYPNPTPGQITILSSEIINIIEMSDLKGKSIFINQPKSLKTSFVLDKIIAPAGAYFVKITTTKGISIHKIIITQ